MHHASAHPPFARLPRMFEAQMANSLSAAVKKSNFVSSSCSDGSVVIIERRRGKYTNQQPFEHNYLMKLNPIPVPSSPHERAWCKGIALYQLLPRQPRRWSRPAVRQQALRLLRCERINASQSQSSNSGDVIACYIWKPENDEDPGTRTFVLPVKFKLAVLAGFGKRAHCTLPSSREGVAAVVACYCQRFSSSIDQQDFWRIIAMYLWLSFDPEFPSTTT